MSKIELLAPAGNMDSLYAAIEGGADAIYLGGTMFSARAFAGNFNNDELVEAVKICHLYGVKVYVTCNILIYEHEVDNFLKYIDFLHQNSVDAIIIQDLGMLDLVHQIYPNLELHASTQMHIHNLDGVIMAKKLGCKRVVLARETSIDDIKEIKKNVLVDLEIFAHGSLCVSYSGQCLFSSLIGNRSGNRGSCVGSCRLPYKIVDENNQKLNQGDYPLSMKDLNTLEYVGELIDAGVTSLKIEGRMKSPEYVYTVTKLYRMAIDSYYKNGKVFIDNNELFNLQKIFNRSYTKGYLFNEDMHNIINPIRGNHLGVYLGKVVSVNKNYITVQLSLDVSINDGLRIMLDNEDYGLILNEFYINKRLVKEAHKNDKVTFKVNKKIPINSKVLLTKDNKLNEQIQRKIKSGLRKVLVDVTVTAMIGNKLEMQINDGKNVVTVEGDIIDSAQNRATTKDEIESKMRKTSNTIYEINNLNINLSENAFIPFQKLNELRHLLFDKLNELRLYKINYLKKDYSRKVPTFERQKLRSVLFHAYEKSKYDIIYSEEKDEKSILKIPKVVHDYEAYSNNYEYLVGELGAFNKLTKINCDYSFNVTNSYTVALLHSLGAKRITLSLELTHTQTENLVKAYLKRYHANPNLEVIVSGYREVMCMKTNLNTLYNQEKLYLEDRFNNHYNIRSVNGLTYIYEYNFYRDDFDFYNIGINILRDNCELVDKKLT